MNLQHPSGWMDALQQAVLDLLPASHHDPDLQTFANLQRDYPARGGKRLRGQFVLASTLAHGGRVDAALLPAAALELFQNWVLVHDDIEDDSEERRGAPALHRMVGMPIALNVGDAMHVAMWAALLRLEPRKDFDAHAIQQEFVRVIERTAEGQHLDLTWVAQAKFAIAEADYMRMVTLKTSWYTVIGPLRMGAFAAGRVPDARFESAGAQLGAAFQIRDDVLNLDPQAATGKEYAGDLYEGKRTLILAHLLAHATTEEVAEAESILRKPRIEKTPLEVARLLALIEQYGARTYAQKVAEREATAALAQLRDAFADVMAETSQRGHQAAARAADHLLGALAELAHRNH